MDRRNFLFGIGGLIAAPAIIPINNLMKLPRVPFVRSDDLWAQLQDTLTGQFHRLQAFADLDSVRCCVNVKCDYLSSVMFSFDRVVIGRGENDFFSMHAARTLAPGDGLKVIIPDVALFEEQKSWRR